MNAKKVLNYNEYVFHKIWSKELTSRPVGQSFYGLDALSLSLFKTMGKSADKIWKERKL